MTDEQAMVEKRAVLHRIAIEEADPIEDLFCPEDEDEELPGMWERADLVGGWTDADSGSLSEGEERERSDWSR